MDNAGQACAECLAPVRVAVNAQSGASSSAVRGAVLSPLRALWRPDPPGRGGAAGWCVMVSDMPGRSGR